MFPVDLFFLRLFDGAHVQTTHKLWAASCAAGNLCITMSLVTPHIETRETQLKLVLYFMLRVAG